MQNLGDALVGKNIGNWQILRVLGEGAFGIVFEAQNSAIEGRMAAIKILNPEIAAQRDHKQRFIDEASAASRAEHENIIQIFDAGFSPDGLCYAVMERLRGKTLGEVLKKGAIGLSRTVNIGVQTASAIGAAHKIGIVHRDLKPENIFITPRNTNPEFVKVLDFGIAKLTDRGKERSTNPNVIVGTPAYMAPEQWQGAADIDGRADIYSLGIILFLCSTGRLPFVGNSPFEWITLHATAPLPDPVKLGVPVRMARLIMQMTAKHRDDRPGSIEEVVAGLREARAQSRASAVASTLVEEDGRSFSPPPSSPVVRTPSPIVGTSERGRSPMPAAATPVARAPAQPATRLTPQIADRAERGRGMIIGGLVALVAALGFGGYLLFSALRGSGGDKSSPSAIGRTDVKEHQASSPLAQALTPKLPDEIVVFGPGKIAIGWGTDPSHLDAPAHDVSVGRFGMSKYETSNAEYKTYFDAVHPSAEPPWVGANFDTISENPVVLITQGEAEKYCEWKYSKWKGRLPSEDEWEYAARDGKSDRRFPWDDGRFDKKKSNAARGEGAPLIPVDSFPEGASPRGLLNLIGNAAEWTASPAALYSGSHAQVRAEGVVVRGGAANTSTTEKLTATARIFVPPETRDPYVGFRCAVTIEPSR